MLNFTFTRSIRKKKKALCTLRRSIDICRSFQHSLSNYALIISHCFWENVRQNIYYETSHVLLTVQRLLRGYKNSSLLPMKKRKKTNPKLCGLLCCFTGLSPRLEGWGWTSQPNPSRQLLLTADPAHHSRDGSLVFAFRRIVFSGLGRRSSASLSCVISSKSLPTASQWVWMYLGMLKDRRAGWFPLSLL